MVLLEYKQEFTLEEVNKEFDAAVSQLILNPNYQNILEANIASLRKYGVLKEINEVEGGIPMESALNYTVGIEKCIKLIDEFDFKDSMEKSNAKLWSRLMEIRYDKVLRMKRY